MKKLLVIVALISASQIEALTVRSDFLRAAQIVKEAKFPLNLKGYLHLSFKLDIDQSDQKGVNATVDKLIAGEVVDTYKGYLVYGERKTVQFSDGYIGPKLLLETDLEPLPEGSPVEPKILLENEQEPPVDDSPAELPLAELPEEEQEIL